MDKRNYKGKYGCCADIESRPGISRERKKKEKRSLKRKRRKTGEKNTGGVAELSRPKLLLTYL